MRHSQLPTEVVASKTPAVDSLVPLTKVTEGEPHTIQHASESLDTIRTALSQETRLYWRSVWRTVMAFLSFSLLYACGVHRFPNSLLASPSFVLTLVAIMVVAAGLRFAADRKRRLHRRHLTQSLAGHADVRSIGPLIDALKLDDLRTREISYNALIPLLPQLKASDAALLNDSQRTKLLRILSLPIENPLYKDVRDLFRPAKNQAIEIRVSILQALEQVGDSKAIPFVAPLAKQEAKTDGERRIKEAAQECLPALKLRAEQQQTIQTLLRASQPSDALPDTLLRAAAGHQDTPSEQLVRASDPPNA